jgi:hypothetical protein
VVVHTAAPEFQRITEPVFTSALAGKAVVERAAPARRPAAMRFSMGEEADTSNPN